MKGLYVLPILLFFCSSVLISQSPGTPGIPQLSTEMRENVSNVQNGLLVFDKDTRSFWYYLNSWMNLDQIKPPVSHSGSRSVSAPSTESISVQISGEEKMRLDSGHMALMFPDSSTIIGFEAGKFNSKLTNAIIDDQGMKMCLSDIGQDTKPWVRRMYLSADQLARNKKSLVLTKETF